MIIYSKFYILKTHVIRGKSTVERQWGDANFANTRNFEAIDATPIPWPKRSMFQMFPIHTQSCPKRPLSQRPVTQMAPVLNGTLTETFPHLSYRLFRIGPLIQNRINNIYQSQTRKVIRFLWWVWGMSQTDGPVKAKIYCCLERR